MCGVAFFDCVCQRYVVCDVCGEKMEERELEEQDAGSLNAVQKKPDAHPGYSIKTDVDKVRETLLLCGKGSFFKKKKEEREEVAMTEEEAATSVWCTVLGKTGQPRAQIFIDGSCRIMDGRVLGFLNDRLQVASAEGHLLGYVLSDQVYDETDTEVGQINRGTGTLRDSLGSTILDADGIGCCRGHTGVVLGQFEGLAYKELSQIALYVLFLDSDFSCEKTADLDFNEQGEPEPVVEEKLPDPVKVEEKVRVMRTDFVRPPVRTDLFQTGSGDKVTQELMASKDVAALDFKSRMALWSHQTKQKELALQPALWTPDMESVSVSDAVDVPAKKASPRVAATATVAKAPITSASPPPLSKFKYSGPKAPPKGKREVCAFLFLLFFIDFPFLSLSLSVQPKKVAQPVAVSSSPPTAVVVVVKAAPVVKPGPVVAQDTSCNECGSFVEAGRTACGVCGEAL